MPQLHPANPVDFERPGFNLPFGVGAGIGQPNGYQHLRDVDSAGIALRACSPAATVSIVSGFLALADFAVVVILSLAGVSGRMEVRDDSSGQLHLHAPSARDASFAAISGKRCIGEQFPVAPHQIIGDAHCLAKHHFGRFRDADIVVLRLRHLLFAVRCPPAMALLRQSVASWPGVLLQFAAHQQVNRLISSPKFNVALQIY